MAVNAGYTVTEFFNGGAEYAARSNVVLSYNVSFRVEWASSIHVFANDAVVITGVSISGTMIIPS